MSTLIIFSGNMVILKCIEVVLFLYLTRQIFPVYLSKQVCLKSLLVKKYTLPPAQLCTYYIVLI